MLRGATSEWFSSCRRTLECSCQLRKAATSQVFSHWCSSIANENKRSGTVSSSLIMLMSNSAEIFKMKRMDGVPMKLCFLHFVQRFLKSTLVVKNQRSASRDKA